MTALVDGLRADGATVTGVVHAAGLNQRTPVRDMTVEEYREVLAAKAHGAHHLADACPDLDLFPALLLGRRRVGQRGTGRVRGGQRLLDAFAQQRRAHGLAATSVAWGLWAEGGMTDDVQAVARLRDQGVRPMPGDRALAVLESVLADGAATAVVADVDWARFTETFTALRRRPLLDALPGARAADAAPGEPAAGSALRDRLTGPARKRAAPRTGPPGPLPRRRGPGGTRTSARSRWTRPSANSASTRWAPSACARRLSGATGLALPSTLIFDHPNAAALAAHLRTELFTDPTTRRTRVVRAVPTASTTPSRRRSAASTA